MSSIDKIQKGSMYRSYCPVVNYPQVNTATTLNLSMISADRHDKNTTNQHRQNHLTYRYQRVGNMFKLVEVKSNENNDKSPISNKSIRSNNSDPKEQPIFQDTKIEKIYDAIQQLTNRIISLELQQAKIPGLEKKIADTLLQNKSLEIQGNYLSEKINGFNYEINQIKERLEEVEEQGGSYQKQFEDIFKLMKQIKQQTLKTIPEQEKKYQMMSDSLQTQVQQQIEKLKHTLREHENFSNKSWQKTQRKPHSPSPNQKTIKPFKLKYRQTYEIDESVYSVNQINYKIDKQGRLLDSSGFILLDYNNKEVKLNEGHLRKLLDFGLLS